MDAEALLAQNRRYLNTGSRRLFEGRFQSVHGRDPRSSEWFTHIFGRRPVRGELEILESRQPGDHRLTGFQGFELLMGAASTQANPRLRLYDERLHLSVLLPFVVEYLGYRLRFHPYAERFLIGVSQNVCTVRPNFDLLRAQNAGASLPIGEWSSYMWVATLGSGMERLARDWEHDTGLWEPVFTGRPRPAHAPVPVPLLSIGAPEGVVQSPRTVLANWDPWADAAAAMRRFGPSFGMEPEPEANPSDPASSSGVPAIQDAPSDGASTDSASSPTV